jgi:Uma2 family endonuclease
MTAAIAKELAEHPELAYRHSVDEYHRMIATCSVMSGEPFELLDGQIVRKIRSASGEDLMTVGVEHALIVKRLAKLTAAFEPFGCHIISQQPITLPPRDEPEPDATVVRGTVEDYSDHHPGAADILCVIEVADSSLARDRGYKLQLYANAGIPMYVIVNLIDRVVEVYRQPVRGEGRFGDVASPFQGQSIPLPTAFGEPVVVAMKLMFL